MGKSDLKRVINAACPEAFEDETDAFDVLVQDTIVSLRRFGQTIPKSSAYFASELIHLDVIVHDLFDGMVFGTSNFEWQVALFDKADYVTIAKQPEQDRRDASVSPLGRAGGQQAAALLRRAIKAGRLAAVRFNKQQWSHLIGDRTARADVIFAVCTRATEIVPDMLKERKVGEERKIVLDFESGKAPCVLSAAGKSDGDPFANCLGEFDVAATFYFNHPKLRGRVLLDSVDTDMLPIALVHSITDQMRIKTTLTAPRRQVFFRPRLFKEWLTSNGYDVDTFVRAYIMAGSDFVPSCPGMSSLKCMQTFMLQKTTTPEAIIRTALGRIRVSQTTRGAALAQRRDKYDLECCSARSFWCLNYWKYSSSETPHLCASPISHGFSLENGRVVYTEDI